jgi:hypothetical protein
LAAAEKTACVILENRVKYLTIFSGLDRLEIHTDEFFSNPHPRQAWNTYKGMPLVSTSSLP